MRTTLIFAGVAALGLGLYFSLQNATEVATSEAVPAPSGSAIVAITLPSDLTPNQEVGRNIFDAKCASCHGKNAVGQQGVAPPLIHKIYEPSHHGDESFQRAVAAGVRQHHWTFGNMPPVADLTRGDVVMIVDYIRELQRSNGIN